MPDTVITTVETAVETDATGSDVLHIRLNRPAKKNALTQAMYRALTAALTDAATDETVGALLLSGGDSFCAGNDIGDFLDPVESDRVALDRVALDRVALDRVAPDRDSPALAFLTALAKLEKPLVAAVAGPAIGIGSTLLLHCDLVYAAPNARFQIPFVALGLCPEAASSLLLPQQLGYRRAAELLLLGEAIDAATAARYGLINDVIDGAALLDHGLAQARRLAALPPQALRLSKQLLKRPLGDSVEQRMALEARHFAERLQTPEARAALGQFFQRNGKDKPL